MTHVSETASGGRTVVGLPASDDASYMTGQVRHPNGRSVVNG